jgi:hypothetical protein
VRWLDEDNLMAAKLLGLYGLVMLALVGLYLIGLFG